MAHVFSFFYELWGDARLQSRTNLRSLWGKESDCLFLEISSGKVTRTKRRSSYRY